MLRLNMYLGLYLKNTYEFFETFLDKTIKFFKY